MYKENIDREIASAMKNGDTIKLTVWRAIKSEFVKFQTSGANIELTDDKELQIINKMVQQRKESIEQFKLGGREELVANEEYEMNILMELLPKEPTEDEIKVTIKNYIKEKDITPSMKDMKDIMNFVKTKYPVANGGVISKIFRENFI